MNEKYNILWIDDQHEAMKSIHKIATDYDIKLWPFKSMNGGCNELENSQIKYDAVLLDAKFYENEDDVQGSEDTKWVHKTKERIRDFDNTLKYFVLTGQAETYGSDEFNNAFPYVFDKGLVDDQYKLFEMLVDAGKNREMTKLKHKYKNAFELCTDDYLGKKEFDRVLKIIREIEKPEKIKHQQDALTPIRKILESIFKKLNEIGLIPDEIQNNPGNFNGASKFISQNNDNYIYKETITDPVISECIRHLVVFTQDASHSEGHNLQADSYLSKSSNTFLYRSLCFSIIEMLDYLKQFIDNNSDKKTNLSKWSLKDIIFEGIIQQDKDGNYHCENYLLNYKLVNEKYKVGQKIKILEATENKKERTKIYYDQYASKFI